MTRFAKHKKEKKKIGEDATPWEEMKPPLDKTEKRKEEKRAEKKRKRELRKVKFFDVKPKIDDSRVYFRPVFDVELLGIR